MVLSLRCFYDVISTTFLRPYFYDVSLFLRVLQRWYFWQIATMFYDIISTTLFLGLFYVIIFTTFPTALFLAHFHDIPRHYFYNVICTTCWWRYFYDVFTRIFLRRFHTIISTPFLVYSFSTFPTALSPTHFPNVLGHYFYHVISRAFLGRYFKAFSQFPKDFSVRHFYDVFQQFFFYDFMVFFLGCFPIMLFCGVFQENSFFGIFQFCFLSLLTTYFYSIFK